MQRTIRFQSTLANPIWKQIMESKGCTIDDTFNSTRSLPIDLPSRKQIFEEVAETNPNASFLKAKQWFKFGKTILGFYRTGCTNTWRLYKDTKQYAPYYKTMVDSRGEIINTRFESFGEILAKLKQNKYISDTESKAHGSVTPLKISRAEFQEFYRRDDFRKLPLFFVLFVVFEELTPFLCYLFPHVTPKNCMIPMLVEKVASNRIESTSKLRETLKEEYIPVHKLDQTTLKQACMSFGIINHAWVPQPEQSMRKKLQMYYDYILLDNELLLNGVWTLNRQELINAVLERQIYNKGEKLYELDLELMRTRLATHISTFNDLSGHNALNNVGGLITATCV